MHVVLFGADENLPTDGMIHLGTHYILKQLKGFENYTHEAVLIDDHKYQTAAFQKDPDVCVLVGTPWIWERCSETWKYRNLLEMRKATQGKPWLLLGLGSCFHPWVVNSVQGDAYGVLSGQDHQAFLELTDGALTILRDPVAAACVALHAGARKLYLLPCPAYWAASEAHDRWGLEMGQDGGPMVVWYNPLTGVSKCGWNDRNRQKLFLDQYKTATTESFYFVQEEEIEMLPTEISDRPFKKLTNPKHAMEVLFRADRVLSGRVHLAIPAISLNKETKLLPVDTRAETASYGVGQIRQNKYLDHYKALIEAYLENFPKDGQPHQAMS